MKNIIACFMLIIASCNSIVQGGENDLQLLRKLELPFSSTNLPTYLKGADGYFEFDTSFHTDSFGTPSRIFGLISPPNGFQYLLVEQQYNDDGAIEPALEIFSYYLGRRIDSLTLNLTVEWEGSYTKRFKIDKSGDIHITTVNAGYDLEISPKDTVLITDTTEEDFRLDLNGMFSKIKKEIQTLRSPQNRLNTQIWKGQYEIATTGISWLDSSLVSIRYFISIDKTNTLTLSIGATSISDYNCEGTYEYWLVGDTLHTWGMCDPELKSNFKMLRIDSIFYISSQRFVNSKWQLLTKIQ